MDGSVLAVDSTNAKPIFCRHCGSQFLSAGVATCTENGPAREHFQALAEANLTGPGPGGGEGTAPPDAKFWRVGDMWDFDNYGQSRAIAAAAEGKGVAGSSPEAVYVVCADCDRGPVGIRFRPGEAYYLAPSLIRHDQPEGSTAVDGALPPGMSEDFIRSLIAQKEQQQQEEEEEEEGGETN